MTTIDLSALRDAGMIRSDLPPGIIDENGCLHLAEPITAELACELVAAVLTPEAAVKLRRALG